MNDYKEMIEYLRATANEMTAADVHAFGVDDDVVVESEDAGILRNAADAIEQLVKERDAAVEDIHMNCETCRHSYRNKPNGGPCDRVDRCTYRYKSWEWRGVMEDNDVKTD